MGNATVTDTSITIHGRGSLEIPFVVKAADGTVVDISGWVLYFEVDGPPIRELLVRDLNNPTGQLIKLQRGDVEMLKTTDCQCIVVDETNIANDLPIVLWAPTIKRVGFKGAPDTLEG